VTANQRSAHSTLTFYHFTTDHYSPIYALVFSQGVWFLKAFRLNFVRIYRLQCVPHVPPIAISLTFWSLWCFLKNTNHKIHHYLICSASSNFLYFRSKYSPWHFIFTLQSIQNVLLRTIEQRETGRSKALKTIHGKQRNKL